MSKRVIRAHQNRFMAFLLCLTVLITAAVSVGNYGVTQAADEARYMGTTITAKSKSAEDATAKANEVNARVAEEGNILLKNKGDALPIKGTEPKVSVFGKNTIHAVHGGSGSSGGTGAGDVSIYSALEDSGFKVNPTLKSFYEDNDASGAGRPASPSMGAIPTGYATGETEASKYTKAVKDSFVGYKEAAIVMISRIGGEGYDLPRQSLDTPGRKNATEHYLELDDNEKDLLRMVTASGFDKVILVINAAQTIELGFLQDDTYGQIDAAVWIGLPGGTGFTGLGKILNGSVNPSGRTVDTFARDFTADPTWQNISYNDVAGSLTAPAGNEYVNSQGQGTGYYSVTYEEGIYVGYRYYETRGFVEDDGAKTYSWYNNAVVYPFGYGLSYTEFEWAVNLPDSKTLGKDDTLSIDVTVTNTGDVAGKEVVQVYYSAPYTPGKIEKAHVVLGGFAKTPIIQPNGTATVTIKLDIEDMASYDYLDANGNNFKGFEVEGGEYTIFVGRNAHDAWTQGESEVYTVPAAGFKYEMDVDKLGDGNDNQFDDAWLDADGEGIDIMSRDDFDGTFPSRPTLDERKVNQDFLKSMPEYVTPDYDDGARWYSNKMPNQAAEALTADKVKVVLSDLIGKDYDDELWDTFLDQMTIAQLAEFINNGAYMTYGLPTLGVPQGYTPDGPIGFTGGFVGGFTGCFFVSPCVMAATWNVELMEEMGEAWGEEGLWNNAGAIYAPATNLHRSPFSGRNFEYYSEDGFLAGKIGAPVVRGLQSKGVVAMIKHFALNDQETNRTTKSLLTWADEQTIRELYLSSFRLMVEEGGAMGIMSAFNRIGKTWAGASYSLLTAVLRQEWGFQGAVITDFGGQDTYMSVDQMIRAGNDYYLYWGMFGEPYTKVSTSEQALTPTHVTAMRKAAKNVCFMVANSNTMNLTTDYKSTSRLKSGYVIHSDDMLIDVRSDVFEAGFEDLTYNLDSETPLPEGLTLNSNGTITGTVAKGEYTFKIYLKSGDEYIVNGVAEYQIKVLESQEYVGIIIERIDDLQTQIENMTKQVELVKKDIDALKETLNELSAAVDELSTKLDEAKDEIQELKAALDSAKAAIDSLKAADEAQQELIDSLQEKIANLEKELKATKDSIPGGIATNPITYISILALLAAAGAIVLIIKNKKTA